MSRTISVTNVGQPQLELIRSLYYIRKLQDQPPTGRARATGKYMFASTKGIDEG